MDGAMLRNVGVDEVPRRARGSLQEVLRCIRLCHVNSNYTLWDLNLHGFWLARDEGERFEEILPDLEQQFLSACVARQSIQPGNIRQQGDQREKVACRPGRRTDTP